jgi:uncharacterized protein YjdB
VKDMKTVRLYLLAIVLAGAAGCETLYTRDVTAVLTGASTVAVGATTQITCTLEYSDGEKLTLGPSHAGTVLWQTSNADVARVDIFGIVTGIAPGTATITATPSPYTTGTGKRTAGTHQITVQ